MATRQDVLIKLKNEVNQCLDKVLPSENREPKILHRAMRYSVFSGGKRLRPILVLVMGDILGVRKNKLLLPACAIELIHNFSLVHDDLPAMDNDDFRRGNPTCHKKFGEAVAILTGDALLTLGFQILAKSGNVKLTEKIATAIGSEGMAGGQMLDIIYQQKSITKRMKKYIDDMKTGKLFQICFQAPLFYKKVSLQMEKRIVQLSKDFGIAFQIRDDMEDMEGNREKLSDRLRVLYKEMKREVDIFEEKGEILRKILDRLY